MTTIVYDHKNRQIAVDGRTTTGNVINTETAKKWIESDGEFWFLCGNVSDKQKFIDHFKNPSPKKPEFEIDAAGMSVINNKVYYCVILEDGSPCATEIDYSDSMGSGREFAISAIDHNRTALEAIKYAATRDNCTGATVFVFDVDKMEFIE
jgi:ATP-dependent protease HslVU (ClpYQ) peptidase subunit